jgi:hypothetical protein
LRITHFSQSAKTVGIPVDHTKRRPNPISAGDAWDKKRAASKKLTADKLKC